MKCIISGSPSIASIDAVLDAIAESGFAFDEVISGGSIGVETSAYLYARDYGVPFSEFKVNWGKYGKGAWMPRNEDMVAWAKRDPGGAALILVWDGEHGGSAHLLELATRTGMLIYEKVLPAQGGLTINSIDLED